MLLTVQLLHPYKNPFTVILFRWINQMKCYHNQRKELFSNKAKLFQEATVAALSGPGHSCQVVQTNSCTISSSKRDLIFDN